MKKIKCYILLPGNDDQPSFFSDNLVYELSDSADNKKYTQFLSQIEKIITTVKREKEADLFFDGENITRFNELTASLLANDYINQQNAFYCLFDGGLNINNQNNIQKSCHYLLWDVKTYSVTSIKDSLPILSEIAEQKLQNNDNITVLYYPDKITLERLFLPVIKDTGSDNYPDFSCIEYITTNDEFQTWLSRNRTPRKFKHNPKHPRAGTEEKYIKGNPIARLLCSNEAAQAFLDNAIGDIGNSKKLYNFDHIHQKYIIFQDDNSRDNTYHGYHIENENEIPDDIKAVLKKRQTKMDA